VENGLILQVSDSDLELERITEIHGGLDLAGPSTALVSRFVCLRKVTGDVRIGNRTGSPSIGLPNLEGSSVKSLAGLDKLESIGGNLTLHWNPELESLAALGALRSVGGILKIDGSPKLRALHGLEGITWLLAIDVSLPALDSLQGLRNLQVVQGSLEFRSAGSEGKLRSFEELVSLERIGGYFSLSSSSLESVGFPSLKSVGDYVSIRSNSRLASLGFGALERIDGHFSLEDNAALVDLSGVEPITTLDSLWISENGALTTLSAFARLETITGDLQIGGNPALTSLGLRHLSSVAGRYLVHHNATLPACAPDELAQKIGAKCPDATACDAACHCEGNDGTGTCP
jgi:hypothetical protein